MAETETEPLWILYVSQDAQRRGRYDSGSLVCMRFVNELDLGRVVAIQDCDTMREIGVERPTWLKGTPTLVHRTTHTIFRGTDAIVHLATSIRGDAAPRPPPPRPPRPPRGGRAAAAAHREAPQPPPPPDNADPFADQFGNLVDNPPEDDGPVQKRVTEADVQAAMDERKRLLQAPNGVV